MSPTTRKEINRKEINRDDRIVMLIGLFKLVKALLFFILTIGALSVLHKDVQEVITYRIHQLGIDPDSRFFRKFIMLLGFATPKKVEIVGAVSFAYATVFAVEGIGLLLRKRWAEYVTAIVTASFLPLEFYELTYRFSYFKIALILLNVGIVVYLVLKLRKK